MIIPVPAGEWLPDQPDLANPGVVEAKNVYSTPSGYRPAVGVGAAYGADDVAYRLPGSSYAFYVDSLGAMYVVAAVTGAPLLETSTLLTAEDGAAVVVTSPTIPRTFEMGDFVRFGNRVFFTRVQTSSQNYRLDYVDPIAGTITQATGGLGSGHGAYLGKINNFLVTGGGVAYRLTLRWSDFADPTSFTVGGSSLAGTAEIDTVEMGDIQAVVSEPASLVIQTNGVSRINYVGGGRGFDTTVIAHGMGCVGPSSVVQVGLRAYFLDYRGVYMTDGFSVARISDNRVNSFLAANMDRDRVVTGVHDSANRRIIWAWSSTDNAASAQDMQLYLSIETGAFTYGDATIYGLVRQEPATGLASGIKSGPFAWVPDGTTATCNLAQLNGATLAAEMTTGHYTTKPGHRTFIRGVEPQYIGSGATVAVSTKETVNGSASVTSYGSQNSRGFVDHTADGRFVAVSTRFPAASSWSEFTGWAVDADVTGEN